MERVRIEKLMTTPKVTPSGRRCPPVADEDRTIGRMGHIQGAAIVTRPDKNANNNSVVISS